MLLSSFSESFCDTLSFNIMKVFLRDLKAGNIKAWGTRLLFAVECVAFSKQQLSTNENRDKISFWEKKSKIGESASRRRTTGKLMRALRKGKKMVFEEKSSLLYYIGSIVHTVRGDLRCGLNIYLSKCFRLSVSLWVSIRIKTFAFALNSYENSGRVLQRCGADQQSKSRFCYLTV